MMIFFIIAAAIIVILLCREATLHKGDFFERTINTAAQLSSKQVVSYGQDNPFGHEIRVGVDPAVDGTLCGDPLYPMMHPEEYE